MFGLIQHSTGNERSGFASRQLEGREWWLWGFAVTVTLLLTTGIIFLAFFGDQSENNPSYWFVLREWVRGLAALVLLFDVYTVYQHMQLLRVRRQLAERDELFQLITENAADMIAVVDNDGRRLYNSPSYQKVLGYSPAELASTSGIDQIHPADRERVMQAAQKAYRTRKGQQLEYRMRHKDGSWKVLESTASVILNEKGNTQKLVIVNRDITERKRAEETLAHHAFYDGLTDLPNRALFLDRLQHALVRARRHRDYKFAVLFVDVDDFKVVNDSLGHTAGDTVLVEVARRLIASFRESDSIGRSTTETRAESSTESIARLGGDEFTVLLEDVSKPSDAIRVAERIQLKLADPFDIHGQKIVITASVGIALNSASYASGEEIVRDAEIAMYRAKRAGKARCEVFDAAMHAVALRRLQLETDLRRGIELGELVVYYQPIVDLEGGRILGFEALSRWKRPEGMVPPVEFIPVADETGLILSINRALMFDACQQLRTWQSQFGCEPALLMSVNIAPKQFVHPQLATEIGSILEKTGVKPGALTLEIMETIAMVDADDALVVLEKLKTLGVRISIDDFGTGYSSLSRLPHFPIDALKIDRIFVSSMTSNPESREIIRLIIVLAHSIGLKIVAEGVETEGQAEELKKLGCEMAQGYLYSPPVASEEATRLLLQSYQGRSAPNMRLR